MTTTIAKVLGVFPVLALVGCVSDFSPDPYNTLSSPKAGPDAGAAGKDATVTTDATTNLPPSNIGDDAATNPGSDPDQPDSSMEPVTGPSGPCDLSGRWIMTELSTSSALGALQRSLGWFYLELTQEGDDVTMTKTLFCGGSVNEAPGQLFTIHEDDSAAWPAYQKMSNYNGRKGTSKSGGSGCDVAFEQAVLVRGCTVATYRDLTVPMPTNDQPASGSTPGWEDWDMDGNPGISMVVTKSATNVLYTSVRTFGTYDGSSEENAQEFQLTYDWAQERTVLGSAMPDPAGILSTPASREPDDSVNYVEFARLESDQATGSDDDICNAIRSLVTMLNPTANPE